MPASAGGKAGAPPESAGGGASDRGGAPDEAPRYVVATAVTDDAGSNTYVKLVTELEGELDLSDAREFPGWSDLAVAGEYVLVSSGEAPKVLRFRVSDAGELEADGEIGFGNHVDDAGFYNQTVINDDLVVLGGDGEYVLWSPKTLEITGTVPMPQLADRDLVKARFSLDRGSVVRGDRMYHTVSWTDTEELHMLPDSRIVVLDTTTQEVVDVITVPCPDLNVADRDEAGNLYFSNWVYSPGATLLREGASACAVRIPAGSESLDDWRLYYAEVSGYEGAALGYLGDGKFLFSSFRNDPKSYDPETDWFDWLFGNHWQLEAFDLEAGTSEPVLGTPQNGGGYYAEREPGVSHVLIPGDGYATTTIFAVEPSGKATQELHTVGWATRLFKLR